MAEDAGVGVAAFEFTQEIFERRELRRGEVVLGLSLGVHATGQAHADGFRVVAAHVCADLAFPAPCFQSAVAADHIVIADGIEAALLVPLGDLRDADVGCRAGGGTVHDDQVGGFTVFESRGRG